MYVIATVFCSNFHFSVSLHVPFSQFLFERDSYSNEYLLAKFGFDTAENEPRKVHLIFKLWDLFFVDPPCPLAISGPPQKRILQRRSLEDTASFVVY